MFWIALAILLTVSATLNAYAVVAADDRSTQLLRGGLSVTLLLLAALSVRKGLAERSVTLEGTPGAIAAGRASRRGMIPVLGVAILIVVVVVAGIAARSPSLSMPESLAGHSRLHDPTIAQLQQSFKLDVGEDSVVGVYGTANQPRFIVAGFDTAPEPGRDMSGELARGLDQSGVPGSIDMGSKTTRRLESVMYSCAPFSVSTQQGATISGTWCDWNDGESYGFVMTFDPTLDAADLAREAHEAVVG
jgi:hypothetical protein